jgi:hypothetical protein
MRDLRARHKRLIAARTWVSQMCAIRRCGTKALLRIDGYEKSVDHLTHGGHGCCLLVVLIAVLSLAVRLLLVGCFPPRPLLFTDGVTLGEPMVCTDKFGKVRILVFTGKTGKVHALWACRLRAWNYKDIAGGSVFAQP